MSNVKNEDIWKNTVIISSASVVDVELRVTPPGIAPPHMTLFYAPDVAKMDIWPNFAE